MRLTAITLSVALGLFFSTGCMQRRLMYFPTHEDTRSACSQTGLSRWEINGEYTGYKHTVSDPRKVWLFLHGNGGQAGNRGYILSRIGSADTVFILEYPGYGDRPGTPSKHTFDQAAFKAYYWIVREYGIERLIVLGESLGSGPACELARAQTPPRHIVLVVPFDVLEDVAREKFPYLPVSVIMLDRWNNIAALRNYRGRLDIFGAAHDEVIPVRHARNLAQSFPGARYHEFDGGHNWSASTQVDLSLL